MTDTVHELNMAQAAREAARDDYIADVLGGKGDFWADPEYAQPIVAAVARALARPLITPAGMTPAGRWAIVLAVVRDLAEDYADRMVDGDQP